MTSLCVLQNISSETSLFYILSNNYINEMIVHRFDFSDEELLAYYISFLKTLSLKLNEVCISACLPALAGSCTAARARFIASCRWL